MDKEVEQQGQAAAADLDMKINTILSIIVQDDGDSFAKRAEMYYQKRPELIQMVEDLHKSYRSLAEKYDQLKSQVNNDTYPRLLSVNQVQGRKNYDEGKDSKSNATAEDHPDDHETELDDYDKRKENKNINGIAFQRDKSDGSQAAMLENEKMWNELRFKVSELVEDNLSHQTELIRRNDEKRETIRNLCSKMNMVDIDNRDVKRKRSQLSRLKRLLLGRFMK
ncbi:hypothetical protein PTKIN_Ptkin02bG0115200 [Pterospermum kingtungense]